MEGVHCGVLMPLKGMELTQMQDHITLFVRSLIRTGLLLTDVAADLAGSLPEDAYPGEEPGAVVLGMVCGSIRSVLETVEPELVEASADLMEMAIDRVEEHLRLSLELGRRMQDDLAGIGHG
jgi:hypothetical protein